MRGLLAAVVAASLCACVPYPGQGPADAPRSTLIEGPFPEPDAGSSRLDSLHFQVRAASPDMAREASTLAEDAYNRIMVDTNLYSFRPKELYQLVVYSGPEEYFRKTAQPSWSGGVSVGNAIFTYAGGNLARTVAHEMTHLIFYEYMGRGVVEHRWVNEGLAVYEEGKAAGMAGRDLFGGLRARLQSAPIPMDQLIRLVPASEREYTVSLWYAESESLVRFMIERGSRLGFSEFLARLREGRTFDEAVASGFPSSWRSLAELERAWLLSLR